MTKEFPNVFVVQTSGGRIEDEYREWHLAEATRWCDEIFQLHTYIHGDIDDSQRDRCLTEAKPGDIALVYSIESVAECPKQIKHVCTIVSLTKFRSNLPNRLLLELRELQYGVTFAQIESLVRAGRLSKKAERIGRPGNIFKIDYSDYETIIEESKRPPPIEREKQLQEYMSKRPLDKLFPHSGFEGYELHAAEYPIDNGSGRIDLLYTRNKSEYLIVELKMTDEESAVNQIKRYMGWIKKNKNATKVRGLIVGPNDAESLRKMAQGEGVGFAAFDWMPKLQMEMKP